jgi:hypothetical protein
MGRIYPFAELSGNACSLRSLRICGPALRRLCMAASPNDHRASTRLVLTLTRDLRASIGRPQNGRIGLDARTLQGLPGRAIAERPKARYARAAIPKEDA